MFSVMLITTFVLVFGIGRCYLQITVFLPEFSPSSPQTAFFSPKPDFTRTPCGIGFFGDFCLRGLKSADFTRVFKLSHCLLKSGVFLQSLNGDSDSKSVGGSNRPGVRIPPSPPEQKAHTQKVCAFILLGSDLTFFRNLLILRTEAVLSASDSI